MSDFLANIFEEHEAALKKLTTSKGGWSLQQTEKLLDDYFDRFQKLIELSER